MPETPIHHHHRPTLPYHNIRRPRQRLQILSISEPIIAQKLTHQQLGFGVGGTDFGHIGAAKLF